MVAPDPAVPQRVPRSVTFAPSTGPSSHGDPDGHDGAAHRSYLPDDVVRAPSSNGTTNKLRKPVPAARAQEIPDTSHANVPPSPEPQHGAHGPAPMADMSNVAHEEAAGRDQLARNPPVETRRPPSVAGDRSSQKNKPKRDQPTQASQAPVILSTPPRLGMESGGQAEHETLANIPVAEGPPADVAGTQNDMHGKGAAGRPNVLKKKPSQQNVAPGMPTQAPGGHAGDGEDKMNIHISNNEYGDQGALRNGGPGHKPNVNVEGRPQPPDIRKGHPAVSHSDTSRPDTLHLPIQDGIQDNRSIDGARSLTRKAQDKNSKSPEDILTENERLAGKSQDLDIIESYSAIDCKQLNPRRKPRKQRLNAWSGKLSSDGKRKRRSWHCSATKNTLMPWQT